MPDQTTTQHPASGTRREHDEQDQVLTARLRQLQAAADRTAPEAGEH